MTIDHNQLNADMDTGAPGQTWTPIIKYAHKDHGPRAIMRQSTDGSWVSVSDYLSATARADRAEAETKAIHIAAEAFRHAAKAMAGERDTLRAELSAIRALGDAS